MKCSRRSAVISFLASSERGPSNAAIFWVNSDSRLPLFPLFQDTRRLKTRLVKPEKLRPVAVGSLGLDDVVKRSQRLIRLVLFS